jgi:hypothetical protein
MLKEIYSFTVEDIREVEEKTKEKRKNDKGIEEEVEITKKVEKKVPFQIVLKEPTRRELEEADMEFSIEMSKCIKKGILTKAMLAKKYSDTGGLLAESDATKLVDLYSELADGEAEYTRRTLQNKNVKRLPKAVRDELSKLGARIAVVRRDIVNLESSYQSLFNHTADTKAQNRIVMWYVTHLSYFKAATEEEDKLEPLFEGETFEAKIDSYYHKDESGDSLYQLVAGKLAALVSYWYFSNEVEEASFDKIINDIDNPI